MILLQETATLAGCLPAQSTLELMNRRRSVAPANLRAPAPGDHELEHILTVASRVPDHGMLVPWRFILVRDDQTDDLLAKFLNGHAEEEADEKVRATMSSRLRTWLIGPPAILFLIWRPQSTPNFPELDQLLCAGAVATTFLHAVHATGYASIWLTGWPCFSDVGHRILRLAPEERILGLFPLGTAIKQPPERARPDIHTLLSHWHS